MSKVQQIKLNAILIDERTQHRTSVNHSHIDSLKGSIEDGDTLKPIEVLEASDSTGGVYYLTDGYHRREAYDRLGIKQVLAKIVGSGTIDDAIFLSLKANAEHEQALVRTHEDIEKAVSVALDILFKKSRCLDAKSDKFNPYPIIKNVQVQKAVGCRASLAEKKTTEFNRRVKVQRDTSILVEHERGITVNEIAKNHAINPATVRAAIKRLQDNRERESSRVSGWERSREKGYDRTHGEEKYVGRSKYDHKFTEKDLVVEADLTAYLLESFYQGGNQVSTELTVRAGRIDILTEREIVEVKRFLNRENIFHAIGQLTLYKNSYRSRKITIAGKYHADLEKLKSDIADAGIDVVQIDDNGEIKRSVIGIANGVDTRRGL